MRNPVSPFALLALMALSLPASAATSDDLLLVGRLSWGETAQGDTLNGQSASAWLDQQLHPSADDRLPTQVLAAIDAMEISHKTPSELTDEVRVLRQDANRERGSAEGDAARKTYQQKLNGLMREAQSRSLLRDLYSKNQLKEQLTWFWFNHFNVHAPKGEIRALVADYEDQIRNHALGKFRDLLLATVVHPAMLQYLDNAQNAAGHLNENYAREIMELHTLGVGSGYSQQDVQELARILTGLTVNLSGKLPGGWWRGDFRLDFPDDSRHIPLTVFNPQRHDFGEKRFLGTTIKGRGIGEIATAITILSVEPPTAHYVSRQLAQYFCCDQPSEALVHAMTLTWRKSDGDIAEILRTLFASEEFAQSLGKKFKDPIHYAVSAVRATYGNQVIVNAQPMLNWLNRMGEPLFGHETPDGYALTTAGWSGPGEMATRFEIAQIIGSGARNLFRSDDPAAPLPLPQPPPILQQTAYYTELTPGLSPATAAAIAKGQNQVDRNMLFLSSPEFMRR
ncbi:MAG TPA: DUF1800 domain-containing protein [Rhizomicrobium sp.]|nr:DUF1800 domain-containing protein [Rhizomicrobium sp.]